MADKTFADGLIFKLPREGAPEFVKGSLSIKVEEFKAFLDAHVTNAGWVNLDLKVGQSGKPYAELNTYKPEAPDVVKEEDGPDTNDASQFPAEGNDLIPF